MQYAQLGRSRLEVSRLCLGTMNFGAHADPSSSHAMLDRAVDAGINYVDTANSYGADGVVEQIIGEWFSGAPARRDRVVIATKLFEAHSEWPNSGGLSALNIRRACDASLRRLRTDHIDILQMHHVDRLAPWPEVWEAFSVLREQGKILYVGSSNFAGWQLAVGQYEAEKRNLFGLVSEQSIYNLAQRAIQLEVLPAAQALGIGLVAWSPLASGLLARSSGPEATGRRAGEAGFAARASEHSDALAGTHDLARRRGTTVARLAIAWLLGRPGLTAAIIGPRTLRQLDDLISASDLGLTDEETAVLDQLWPGPGTAPEAYAW